MAEVSREYAAALFELAKESGKEKAFLDALQGIRAQLDAQPEYYALLSSPNLSIRQRQELHDTDPAAYKSLNEQSRKE